MTGRSTTFDNNSHHEMPNFCPHDFSQLSYHARHTLRRMRRRPTLVMAFWEQADPFPL
jgi:hypothetical protein